MTQSLFATYDYDAWGKLISVKDASGNTITSDSNFAILNSIRYRGYYYDTESGLYYLQSRYYDPTTGRFVNADDLINDSIVSSGLNTFTYCNNNSINAFDNNGHWLGLFYRGECIGHYFTNRNIKISGYIYGQGNGNVSKIRFGFSDTANSGCGWIATYNALLMLGKRVAPCDIIYYYELTGAFCGGVLGVNPYSIITYFFYSGYKVSVTYDINKFDTLAKKSKANILVYLHSKGGHYFAFKWQNSQFWGYNVSNRDKSSKPLGKSIKAFIRNGNYWQREYMLISIS